MYIVATPIGHLGDISARALEVLAAVDLIAAEDTRRTAPLLRRFGITTSCTALHDYNERGVGPRLVARLVAGESIALVSDAGTPLISDPGFHLVRAVQEAGIRVVPVPGACALIAALSVSGQSAERFVFEGFMPAKSTQRVRRLETLRDETRTLVFYEAPHRSVATLKAMVEAFGADREAAYIRELTKIYETVRREPLGKLLAWVQSDPVQQKGEIVIVVQGVKETAADETEARRVLEILLEELPLKPAAALAAKLTGVAKNALYQWGLSLQQKKK